MSFRKIFYRLVLLAILDSVRSQLGIKSTTMKIATNSSVSMCATSQPSAVYNVRSAIDCQLRCTTSPSLCYFANFYGDGKRCETFHYYPTIFANDMANCVLYKNSAHPDNSTVSQLQSASSCTEFKYIPAAGKYYKAITTGSDWNTAVKTCQEFGPFSHLVALESSDENAAVTTFMSATYPQCNNQFWTCGFRTTDQPTCAQSYNWAIDGWTSVPMTYGAWSSSDPQCGTERCVETWSSYWRDMPCANKYCAICELEMVQVYAI